MKILQVISSFPPAYSYGGPVKVAYDISKELIKKGHSVDVFTTDVLDNHNRHNPGINPEYIEGIKVFRFKNISNRLAKKNYPLAPFMFFYFKKICKDIDIIHLHEYRSFQAIITHFWARYYNIPYILQAHGSVLPKYNSMILKKIYDFFYGKKIIRDSVRSIGVSGLEKQQYLQMGVEEKNIIIIPNGIDITEYQTLPQKGLFKKKYGINDDECFILYLGRLHKNKGIDLLIDSFHKICWQKKNLKLVLVGIDDGFLDAIVKKIKILNLQKKVIITGPLYNGAKKEAYVDAEILVYPCSFEIFGLVPFEALLCGTPVIVSEECGCGEMIKKANCGLLINQNSCNDLAEKICEMIEKKTNNDNFVINGKEYINSNLDISKNILIFEKIYGKIINTEIND